jgi:hypothetical protein
MELCKALCLNMAKYEVMRIYRPTFDSGGGGGGTRGGAVGRGTALEARKSRVRISGFTGTFHWHNPSGRTMALGSTQPLTEMSTKDIS